MSKGSGWLKGDRDSPDTCISLISTSIDIAWKNQEVMILSSIPPTDEKEETGPRVLHLADLADYQEGAVVSREIIRKSTGTVTLFAFDKGQGLSEHIAPFDALVQILDGEAEITISGKKYHLVQGQMVILPANKPHALQAPSRFKMLLVMIRS